MLTTIDKLAIFIAVYFILLTVVLGSRLLEQGQDKEQEQDRDN
jgi:hypothetical protein